MNSIEPGLYKHWKGNFYRVLFCAVLDDSITGIREPAVVYIPLTSGDGTPNIRSIRTFTEEIKQGEYKGPRFFKV